MPQQTINQMIQAANEGDNFALAAYAVLLYEGESIPRNSTSALKYLEVATSKGVLWAKDMLMCITQLNAAPNVRSNALISTEAQNQLQHYSDKGNLWARTILAKAMYTGSGMSQDRDTALTYLNYAAQSGNLWAKEILSGISKNNSSFARRNESSTWKHFSDWRKQTPKGSGDPKTADRNTTYSMDKLFNSNNIFQGEDRKTLK